MNKFVAAILFIGLGAAIAVFASIQFMKANDIEIASNRFALESDLRKQIDAFHSAHSRNPKSLDEIEISWIKTKERRDFLFKPFYYEDRGDSYVLWWPRSPL